MSTIQRPTKQGGATTYQGKVAAGYKNILASEMDADLDAVYSAWNTGVDTVNIRDGSITSSKLAPGAVGSRELADGGIQTVDLADGAVTTPKIADGAIVGTKIPAGSITGAQIAPQTIEGGNVAFFTLTSGHIVYQSINGDSIAPHVITALHVVDHTLTGGQMAFETISNTNLALGASARTATNGALAAPAIITGSQRVLAAQLPTVLGGLVGVPVSISFHLGGTFSVADTVTSHLNCNVGFNGSIIMVRDLLAQGSSGMVNATLPWTIAFSLVATGAADPNYVEVYLQRTAGITVWNVDVGQVFMTAFA